MSGSSGGSGPSGPSSFDCKDISTRATINSPDAAVLATVNVGDRLKIRLRSTTGPIEASTQDDRLLGSVYTSSASSLIECMNDGHSFTGKVLKVSGGYCEILITSS